MTPERRNKAKRCSIEGCGRPAVARGWCSMHAARWRRHGDPLGGRAVAGEPERFFRDVALVYAGDDCLIWPFGTDSRGYGQVWLNGRVQRVHRLVCEAVNGPAPTPDSEAAHSCGRGNRGCVSPWHVRWATHAENEADKQVHGTHNRGERCGTAKLTEDQVQRIRSLDGSVSHRNAAESFGVSHNTIGDIQRGKSWGWLA